MAMVKKLIIVFVYLMAFHAHSANSEWLPSCPSVHEKPIVIFIEPTKEKIRLLQEKYGDNYSNLVSDIIFYRSEDEGFLKVKKFPFCRSKRVEHLFVIHGKGNKVNFKKECDGWCMIYWDGKNYPILNPEKLSSLESFNKQPFLVLKPGSTANDFRFLSDGSVYFKDKIIHKYEFLDVAFELHISQPSPMHGYFYVVLWDTDKGGVGSVIVDGKEGRVIARFTQDRRNLIQVIGEEIRWSPNESYAIVPERGEVQRYVNVIDLKRGNIFPIDIGNLEKNECQIQFIDPDNGSWLNEETYHFRVEISLNPWWKEVTKGLKCNENERYPSYETEVNARTKQISKMKISPAKSESNERIN